MDPIYVAPVSSKPTGKWRVVRAVEALFYAAATAWAVAGPCGLLQALEDAQGEGSGWTQLGALVLQTPCTILLFLAVLMFPAFAPPGRRRFLRWGLVPCALAVASHVAMWWAIASLPGGGC